MRTVSRLACAAAISCLAGIAIAAETVSIPINGVRFQNNLAQSRNSGASVIDPAFRYSMRFSENTTASGSGGVLGALYPNPVPLSELFDDLTDGAFELQTQSAANPSGTLPASLPPQVISEQTTISGINVTFGMTINAGADAAGVCSFSLSGVVISPSILVGSLVVSQGSIIVTAHCLADLNLDQGVTIDDLLTFLTYFEAGDIRGDMNRDEGITIDDLLAMLTHFESGC